MQFNYIRLRNELFKNKTVKCIKLVAKKKKKIKEYYIKIGSIRVTWYIFSFILKIKIMAFNIEFLNIVSEFQIES